MKKENRTNAHPKEIQGRDVKGRILKVKHGYNPNSSSLGSIVFSLPVMLIGVSTLFSVAASVLFAAVDYPSRRRGVKTLNSESGSGNGATPYEEDAV